MANIFISFLKTSKRRICKINLPVVEIGEEHDSAKEEGHEHEEAVDHVEHAVLHEHELEHKQEEPSGERSFFKQRPRGFTCECDSKRGDAG